MGAYIFPFRNYRPDEAGWMTPDPSGFPDGPNNRKYVCNVLNSVDRLGLDQSNAGTLANSTSYNWDGMDNTANSQAEWTGSGLSLIHI